MLSCCDHKLRVDVGFATEKGKRAQNEDFVAACYEPLPMRTQLQAVAAVADGVGGHKGGRQAAETAVRCFIDGYYAQPETVGVARGAARALEATNRWIATQARVDPELAGMSTTFSALIVSRRMAHVVHVGDSRVYRLGEAGLELLTTDHVAGSGDFAHALRRAIGFEDTVHFDHATFGLSVHDRFLLCTDGVHGFLRHSRLRELLGERLSPNETARNVVAAALDTGGSDNATALVVDILDLPLADESEISRAAASLPIEELPEPGSVIDEFRLDGIISDGRYSRLMRAADLQNGKTVVLKFPHPRVAEESSYRLAFINETWVAARVRSPWIGEVIEIPPDRQTRLYSVMPFYDGETLETRLRRSPKLGLGEGVRIATRLARAITALHRAGIIHRDIKPDNVILLNDGGLRLVDLGVCRVPHLEDFPEQDIPGTPSYVAPELFGGAAGDERSDQYALGVTIYRAFCGGYPYGEIEPFSTPRFGKPQPLCVRRPDLPAWLDAALLRAVAVNPRDRFGDVLEFAFNLENGAVRGKPLEVEEKKSLYDRNPLVVWQGASFCLFVLLIISLMRR